VLSVSETNIDSFIIRFVHDRPCGDSQKSANWRGFIRHVQCKESIQFTNFEEALEFIAKFVHLSTLEGSKRFPAKIWSNLDKQLK
jgi:hypothetical protein